MKYLIKDTLILFVITLIAGVLLGFVNELTKEPIAQYEAEKKALACSEVFYETDENGELNEVISLVFADMNQEEILSINDKLAGNISESIVINEIYRAYRQPASAEEVNANGTDADLGELVSEDDFYGYVIGVTTKEGYNGNISFYTGITKEGRLKGVSLLQIAETPGLGMSAERVLLPQFRDVEAMKFTVVKTGAISMDEIDAISGATVTSDAITEGVNAAYECYCILQEGGETL